MTQKNTLTSFAIDKNRITFALVAVLFISGLAAYYALPKAMDPGFTVRTAVITSRLPGVAPERMEQLVTDKIEKKAQEMPEVDFIVSESRTGISVVNVNFKESYKNMRPIFDDLRRKIGDVEGDLPKGVDGPHINDEFGDVFGSVYTLTGDGFSYAELKTVADEIRDRLLKEPDIAKVEFHGAQQEVVFIDYNNARLTELGLSPQQLSGVLNSVNILSSGGNITSGRERIALEPTGNFESLDDLRSTVIELPRGGLVSLGDIARVYRDYLDPPSSMARANGVAALTLSISMTDGGDILKLGKKLNRLIPEIQQQYPWGIELEKVWFQAQLVEENVNNFMSSLLQAIAIVVLVMVAFLGLRTGAVVAILIPATMVITFFVMQQFDITVNQISLAALIISLGLLVDNAIVMVESILLKREGGMGAIAAAIEAGSELKIPLLVSSLTTAAAFMPIGLAESAVGEYTADIFYVVGITLLCSWGLTMTLIPVLTTSLLKVKQKHSAEDELFDGGGYRFYRQFLLASLRRPKTFLLGVVVVFVLAMQGMGLVPQIFIAPSEDPVFTAKLEMPLGTAIETTEQVVAELDHFITEQFYRPQSGDAAVSNWMTFIGDGGPRFALGLDPANPNPANAFMIVNTSNGRVVDDVIAGINQFLRNRFPDLATQLSRLENGPPVGYPIQVRLSGSGSEQLYRMAEQVTDQLYASPGVSSVKNNWGLPTKKLLVNVDQERARLAGVTSDDVAYSLRTGLAGIELTQYREGDKLIPVKLRTVASDRQDVGKLDGLSIYAQSSGDRVPLKQVADVELVFEPGVVRRRDRERTLTLNVQLQDGVTAAEVNSTLVPWLKQSAEKWPTGYRFEMGGESESSGDANASIAAKLPLALMVIVLLLVAQFNSIRRPVIILTTIPLGLIGVTIGLLVANSSFGFFTILGVISLAGIIINNAIVLIDRIKIEIEEQGKAPADAVVHACLQRLRPIMLTTATTVLGMMPLWWGGTAMFVPMAVTIIFGLAFATLLTLLVVPVLYAVFFRVRFN
ncbi:efflux RND transporter permease subunit [Porticoccus sp. W117]|uniref:efflux RND transporter permease subunit n=1 Tax=Porticoccus sp. W117 TaxID=3054777 RepID=UPI002596523A|nr:efflux RND transporter permease subunit [Porticoccus sp. W117]MDM3869868.1 efflux RND transporter permease subunit [Porticoccus sp. W117]